MKVIQLPPVIDRTVAGELTPEFADALGATTGLAVAAADVRQIGQCGLQLLLSAAVTAARRNLPFEVQEPSEAMQQALRISGLHRHITGQAVQTL